MIKLFKVFPIVLLAIFMISCAGNKQDNYSPEEITTVKKLTESHKKFILDFYPGAVEANNKVKLERSTLINLRDDYRHAIVKKYRIEDLNELAEEYRFGESFFDENTSKAEYRNKIDTMLYRIDYIPEKLVMAQAIIESGWGKSKFAREINNYFGIHCHSPGCGRPPSKVENPKFWVKSFPSIEACISEYLWTLNTGFAYDDLRLTRKELREQNSYPDAKALARGLSRYSEKGSEYIDLINTIIDKYLPKNLDAFSKSVSNDEQIPS